MLKFLKTIEYKPNVWIVMGYPDPAYEFNVEQNTLGILHEPAKLCCKKHIIKDKFENIWISSENDKILRINTDKGPFSYFRMNPNLQDVDNVFVDHNQYLWAINAEDGWFIYDLEGTLIPTRTLFKNEKFYEKDTRIARIVAKDDKIYIASWLGKIYILNKHYQLIDIINRDNSKIDGWAFRDLRIDQNHNLILASMDGGLEIYNLRTGFYYQHIPDGPFITNVFSVDVYENEIWYSSSFSVCLYNPSTRKSKKVLHLDSKNQFRQVTFVKANDKHVLVAIQNGKLVVYEKSTQKIKTLNLSEANQPLKINSLSLLNKDIFVIGTSRGVWMYNTSQNLLYKFSSDLFQTDSYLWNSDFVWNDSTLLMGGRKGITMVNTHFFKTKKSVGISFDKLFVSNKEIKINVPFKNENILPVSLDFAKILDLNYGFQDFTIQISTLENDFSANFLRYKLVNYDTSFNECKSNPCLASYTNLPYGTYTLWAEGSKDNVTWQNKKYITIHIHAPFWLKWYAFVFYGVCTLLIFYLSATAILKKIREKTALKNKELQVGHEKNLQATKQRFYSFMSHEFKTPLTLIIAPVKSLLNSKKGLDPYMYTLLELILKNATDLRKRIEETLELSRMDVSAMKVYNKLTNLTYTLQRVVSNYQHYINKKHINFYSESLPNPLCTYADEQKLEIILSKLLSNALLQTPDYGKVSVIISAIEIGPISKYIRIKISQEGQAMTEEEISEIFDKKNSLTESKSNQVNDIVWELSFVKQLTELLKGKMEIKSSLHQGTTFFVEIPVETPSAEFAIENSHPDFEGMFPVIAAEGSERSEKILIVEDNPDIHKFLHVLLGPKYELKHEFISKHALETCISFQPNIIITDIMMPELDGLDLCEIIKSNPETSHIPVILLTARGDDETKIKGLISKADDYITKPFNPDELLLRIHNMLQSRKEAIQRFNRSTHLEPSEITITTTDDIFIRKVIQCIENHMENPEFGSDTLCTEVGISKTQLYTKIQAMTHQSVNIFIRTIRLKRAAQILKQDPKISIKEVATMVGFNDTAYFVKQFKSQFGVTPGKFSNQQS